MGVESDQLVFDYLSRVGDLAQRAMPSAERMQLVAKLRDDIDRQRSGSRDSPAAVRRILGRIGSPDAVVERAAGAEGGGARERRAASVPAPRDGSESDDGPDWWRVGPSGSGPDSGSDSGGRRASERETSLDRDAVPGAFRFTPEEGFFDDAEDEEAEGAGDAEDETDDAGEYEDGYEDEAEEYDEGAEAEEAEPRARRRWRRRPAPERRSRAFGWRELAAVALLVGGTVMGQWIAVLAGWVLAYYSLRLNRTETRVAAVGIPLTAVGAVAVWVWGRKTERWGGALPDGKLEPVLRDAMPVAVRIAALASAVFIVWRADRRSRR